MTKTVLGPLCKNSHEHPGSGGRSLRRVDSRSCVVCARDRTKAWKQTDHGKQKSAEILRSCRLRTKYGMTQEQYDVMLRSQGGGCAVCTRRPGVVRLPVDHCHDTGKVRGILCTQCNQALGQLQERADLIDKLAAYLRSHQ